MYFVLFFKFNGCLLVVVCYDVEEVYDDKGVDFFDYDYDYVRIEFSDDEDRLVNLMEEYDEVEVLNDVMEEEVW